MERITWYKPVNGSGVFKSDHFKKNLKKNEDASLVECLHLDTSEMVLLQNKAAFMIVDRDGELKQMAVFEQPDEGMNKEYIVDLPQSGIDLTLFPQEVCKKLCGILQNAPLQIHLIFAFEEKTRLLAMEGYEPCILLRLLGLFENESAKEELCALQLVSINEPKDDALAEKLVNEGIFTPSISPWIQTMWLRESGLKPLLSEKKIKKIDLSEISAMIVIRLFELVRAYAAVNEGDFKKEPVHSLRVEARKMLTLIEIFDDIFAEKAILYTSFLNKLIDDTDELRAIDFVSEELDTIDALYNHFDFEPLKQKLASKRSLIYSTIKDAYHQGSYADSLAAFWVDMHVKTHHGFEDEKLHIVKASEQIKEWAIQLNVYKKSELYETGQMHEYRKTSRKLRYSLESLKSLVQKRIGKAIKSCKALQDEFGMVVDVAQHIKTLQELAAEEKNAELSLLCGVCCGVFAETLLDIQKEAINAWKDCRIDLKVLEDTL